MMGYTASSKAAIKRALQEVKNGSGPILPPILDFQRNVQETSFFGLEAQVPGENTVVGPDAYTDRRWYATLTVNESGQVIAIR